MSKEFVKSIILDNNIEAEKAFNDSISTKVGQALETRRREISQSIVSTNMVETKDEEFEEEEEFEEGKSRGDAWYREQDAKDLAKKDGKNYDRLSYGDKEDYRKRIADKNKKNESIEEGMLGFSGAERLGKSRDSRHKDAASHIDYHLRQDSKYHKAGDQGSKDRMRHAVAKKLGYNV